MGPLKFEASIPTTIYSTYASHEAIHQLFAMVWEPSNLRGRFQQLFAAHSPPMRRSINYLQWFGHPQIGGVGSNNYLQHIRLPQGDPSIICNGLGPLQFEGSIITTICSTFASHQAIHPLVAMVWDPSNLRGRFQQLVTAHSPPMRRSIHYRQWFVTPQIILGTYVPYVCTYVWTDGQAHARTHPRT